MTAVLLAHRPPIGSRLARPAEPRRAPGVATAWYGTLGSSALAAPLARPRMTPAFDPPVEPCRAPASEPVTPPSTPAPPTRAQTRLPPTVRLTRRGRLVATLLGTTLVVALCITLVPAVASGVASAFTGVPPIATTTVTVQPGQTLWQIAQAADPGGDPAQVVAQIADANGLVSAAHVRPGQRLVVPLG